MSVEFGECRAAAIGGRSFGHGSGSGQRSPPFCEISFSLQSTPLDLLAFIASVYSLRLALSILACLAPFELPCCTYPSVPASLGAFMASTELTNSAEHPEKEDRLNASHTDTKSIKELTVGTDGVSDAGAAPVARSRDASPASVSSASGLSSRKGGTQSPAPSGSGNTPPLSMPHPKKFSHVNINKKFLEKTSSGPAHTIAASPALKTTNSSRTYHDVTFGRNVTFASSSETRSAHYDASSASSDYEAHGDTAA